MSVLTAFNARRTTRLIASQLPAGVEIFTEIPEDLDIIADVQKLQEVLLNLLLNASQAMPNEAGRITITAAEDKRAKQVQILVKDSGCGIIIDFEDEEWVADLQDLLASGVNQAIEQSQTMAAERMEKITGGLDGMLPGGLGGLMG